jgi:hypothetical protein
VFLVFAGLFPPQPVTIDAFAMIADTLNAVGRMDLPPDALVLASPNDHLVMSFYGRRPIQSLAPIRKARLDTHRSDVVFIESWLFPEFAAPEPDDVRSAAAEHGVVLGDTEARDWADRLAWRSAERKLAQRVAHIQPPMETLPAFADAAVDRAAARQAPILAQELRRFGQLPVFRGFPIRGGTDLWTTFTYRLVDPVARSGTGLNAYERLRCGTGAVPSAHYVLYRSPAPCD